MKEIIEAVKNSAAIDKAFAFSERYLHKALEMIKPLPRGQAKYALQNVAKYIENENFSVFLKNKIISISKLLHNCDKGVNMCVGIYNYIHNSEVERFLWKTFLMVKPDGVQRAFIGEIVLF